MSAPSRAADDSTAPYCQKFSEGEFRSGNSAGVRWTDPSPGVSVADIKGKIHSRIEKSVTKSVAEPHVSSVKPRKNVISHHCAIPSVPDRRPAIGEFFPATKPIWHRGSTPKPYKKRVYRIPAVFFECCY